MSDIPAPPPPPPAPSAPEPPAPKSFTQEDVNAIATRAAAEAERKARQAVADSLGVSLEDAAAIVKRQQEADQAALTEAQRAQQEAETLRSQAAAEANQARQDRNDARAERLLSAAAPSLEGDALSTVRGMLQIPTDTAPEALDGVIQAEIERVKGVLPALFSSQTPPPPNGGTPPPAPSGVGGPPPPSPSGQQATGLDAGAARFAARKSAQAPVVTGANQT